MTMASLSMASAIVVVRPLLLQCSTTRKVTFGCCHRVGAKENQGNPIKSHGFDGGGERGGGCDEAV